MMELEYTFEQPDWKLALDTLKPGQRFSAARLIALLEAEDEQTAEAFFSALEEKRVMLDISDLPKLPVSGEAAVRLRQEAQMVENGQSFSSLEENDPLRLYLEELAGIPVCGDVQMLAQRYLEGEESVASQLTGLMLSRVVERAREHTGMGVLLLDLIQEASLGLWQGILHYTGGDMESHCDWWICQYLARAVTLAAMAGGVGQKLRQGLEDYRQTEQALLAELGRSPTLEQIAQRLHVTAEEVAVYETLLQAVQVRSRIEEARKEKEPTPEDAQAVEDTAYFQMRQRITELMADLNPEETKLLSMRYGLDGGIPMTPEQIGQKLGLTADEVVAKEAAALEKMRQEQS